MSRYVLSIGGAGHRTLKPLVFLAAAGALGPDDLKILCVDNDATNGNLTESLHLIDLYNRIRGHSRWMGDSTGIFRPKIELIDHRPWSPFDAQDPHPTLDNYFRHDVMAAGAKNLTALYEFLYDREKREIPVTEGFRGRPSIGAAVYRAASGHSGDEDSLGRMRSRIVSDTGGGPVRLLAVGSIFGGTGAAGLPTLPHTLLSGMKQGSDLVMCGGAFLLPYFTFNTSGLDAEGAHANPEDFILMMKDALEYYSLNPSSYRCVYAIGSDKRRHQPTSAVGKAEQKNPSDLTEFLASLAASNFFTTWNPPAGEQNGSTPDLFVLHRAQDASFVWSDVPEQPRIKPLLAAFTRLSFVYLSEFFPELQKAEGSREVRRSAWYRQLIERSGVNLSEGAVQEQLHSVASFCHQFLNWWSELHHNAGVAPNLIDTTAFSNGNYHRDRFPTLITGDRYARTVDDVVRQMAGAAFETGPNLNGFGHFVNVLARATQ